MKIFILFVNVVILTSTLAYECSEDEFCSACNGSLNCSLCYAGTMMVVKDTDTKFCYTENKYIQNFFSTQGVESCCLESCPEVGTYENDGRCIVCHKTCKKCNGYTAFDCLECNSDNPLLELEDLTSEAGICVKSCTTSVKERDSSTCYRSGECPEGYYRDGAYCEKEETEEEEEEASSSAEMPLMILSSIVLAIFIGIYFI